MGENCRKKRIGSMLLLLFSLLVLPVPEARAEEQQALGLDALIQMALDTSPELKEAEQDIMSAKSDLDQAKAGQWAQLDALAILGPDQQAKRPYVLINSDGKTGSIENRDENSVGFFGSLDVYIVQPLYTFGKISTRQDAARLGVEIQRLAKEKKRGEVILNIKQLYYALIVAQQGKGAARDADTFIKDAGKRIERLLSLGAKNVDRSDIYKLEAYQADIERFQVKAETGAQLAYLALKQAVGMPSNKDFKLDTVELPKDVRALGSQEEYIQKAMLERPEFDQLKKGIRAREALVEGAKADLYPSLFVGADVSLAGSPSREHLNNSYFTDDYNHASGGMFLGAAWHFDLGIGQGKVAKARADHQKLIHTKEFAEQNIPVEVAKYYQDSVEARASFQASEKSTIASRKWIIASFASFDVGVGTAKDMFDAIDKYGKNQGDYLMSLYNYNVSLARLSYSIAEYRSGD